MAVELAVCLPVVMAVLAIAFHLMVFLGDCARFDRLVANEVRTGATSPSYYNYSLGSCEDMIELALQEELFYTPDGRLQVDVEAYAVALDGSLDSWREGIANAFLPHHEVYVCTLEYYPLGFGTSFFGIEFPPVTHTRSFTIDPFRPGALL
jgi:hypothetical protein